MDIVFFYMAIVNVVAFLAYGFDKWKARHAKRRISERALLLFAMLGGSVGALAGMQLFHHKTKKPKFYLGVPAILLLQIAVTVAVYYFL